jgi:tungstate transport system substrate-binding protein
LRRPRVPLALAILLIAAFVVGCAGPAAPASAPAATAAAPAPTATSAPKPAEAPKPTPAAAPRPANPDVILSTTTSTQDSGLLDVLLPMFEKQTGYKVKSIAVGSGQAMVMGERGEADVLLVHAPDSEKKYMEAGHGADRKLVMHNDFIIVGPGADPAKIKGEKLAVEALKKIAQARAVFISRGDNSGTHQLEMKLWTTASLDTKGQTWYQQTGQGMGATLNVAAEKNGYTISDRATYLANVKNVKLEILVEGDRALLNIYHVITVNPRKSDKINAEGARAFADFIVAKDAQDAIARFGVDKYGQPLFFADAGKKEEEVGR